MKTKLLILLSCFFLASCTQSKKNEMERDADSLIESCQKAPAFTGLATVEIFMKSVQTKYEGADMMEFMDVLRTKVLEKKKNGEDCGAAEWFFMHDKEFQEIEKINESKEAKK